MRIDQSDPAPEDPSDGSETGTHAEVGMPDYKHNQWTIEGEIERFGAFSSGVTRAHGWKRWVGVFLVVTMLGPIAVGMVVFVVRLL